MSTRLAVRLWWDIICYTYSGRRMGTDREQGSSNNRSYQGHGRCEPLTLPCPQSPAADPSQPMPNAFASSGAENYFDSYLLSLGYTFPVDRNLPAWYATMNNPQGSGW